MNEVEWTPETVLTLSRIDESLANIGTTSGLSPDNSWELLHELYMYMRPVFLVEWAFLKDTEANLLTMWEDVSTC
jgi:hypothetical protein